jgi:hypothetical protein
MASFPVRWWRAILALLQLKRDSMGEQWVEPGNAITRAILQGTVPQLAQPLETRPIAAPAPMPAADPTEVVLPEPAVETEEPAAAAAAEPTKRSRRRTRAA